MATKAPPKTVEQRQAERALEFDAINAMQQTFEQEKAARQAETDAFYAKAQQYHAQHDAFVRRAYAQLPDEPRSESAAGALRAEIEEKWLASRTEASRPTLNDIFQAKAAEERAAEAEAERQRIAGISERDVFISALPFNVKQKISAWESLNPGREYPLAALSIR